MPIYEYECSYCNFKMKKFQKITDKPKKKCPFCKGNSLVKLISKSTFILKGEGWARDGYE